MAKTLKTKAIAIVMAVSMVFAFMPLLGTQEAYAIPIKSTLTIDLSDGTETLTDADARAIYYFFMDAMAGDAIYSSMVPGDDGSRKYKFDLNRDNTDDISMITIGGDTPSELTFAPIGEWEEESWGLMYFDVSEYENMSEFNDYGLDYYYKGVQIVFPEIQHVEISPGSTKWIFLTDGTAACRYTGAEAAAMYTLLMDDAARLNGDGPAIRRNMTFNGEYSAYTFDLDSDNDDDLYATFSFNNNGVCIQAGFQVLSYGDYDTILVNLPNNRLDYYRSLTIPNDYGIEYLYNNLLFDARVSLKDAEVYLSATDFTYNGQSQQPEIIVKIGEKELTPDTDYTVDWSDEASAEAGAYTAKIIGEGHYRDSITALYKINKAPQKVTVAKTAYTKTFGNAAFSLGAKTDGDGTLKYSSGNTKVATVSSAGKVTIKGAGTAKIKVYAAAGTNYAKSAVKTVTVKVNKAKNPMIVTGKTGIVKYSKVKKAAQKLAVSKVLKFTKKAPGTVTYTKSKGNGKITIAKKTGKVTVKKGLKKGTYTVKVKVKAAATKNYNALTKTVTFKIKVK